MLRRCLCPGFYGRPLPPSTSPSIHVVHTASRIFKSNHGTRNQTYELFFHSNEGMSIRHGLQFIWNFTVEGVHSGTHHGSVTITSSQRAILHSRTQLYLPANRPTSFLAALKDYRNPSLWVHLSMDGDGEWIHTGIEAGTIDIAHDGSECQKILQACALWV
jgi:hypothetical protein